MIVLDTMIFGEYKDDIFFIVLDEPCLLSLILLV